MSVHAAAYASSNSLRKHVARCHGEGQQQQQQQQPEEQEDYQPDGTQHAADCNAAIDFVAEQLQGLSDVEWVASDAEEEEEEEAEEEEE
jgi:hypothetical protein